MIAYSQNQASKLESQVESTKQGIEWLTSEQKEAAAREMEQLGEGSGDPDPLEPGEYYFLGTGRDIYDGHGVGMSQWGAYGMAANHGWSAQQILQYYYTGVNISQYSLSSEISIIFCPDNPTYDTPPCSGRSAETRRISFDDYLTGIGEVPDSWPFEVVKAQVIAARTYATRSTGNGNPNSPICITASCQVHYLNTEKKRAAVNATKDLVILYNESLISAVYHASARGHTQNNEYRWTRKSWSTVSPQDLLGWPAGYLKGVDDSAYSYKNQYYNWKWRVNSYSLEELSSIFSRDNATNVGQIIDIKLYREFNRVWAVEMRGTNGIKYIASWKFKDVFNSWIYSNYPVEKRAYLFSTDFYFMKV
jgi:SpoIID/LytB domain protein